MGKLSHVKRIKRELEQEKSEEKRKEGKRQTAVQQRQLRRTDRK